MPLTMVTQYTGGDATSVRGGVWRVGRVSYVAWAVVHRWRRVHVHRRACHGPLSSASICCPSPSLAPAPCYAPSC